jgi:hypothetical protein
MLADHGLEYIAEMTTGGSFCLTQYYDFPFC